MSNRRLASDEFQPESFEFNAANHKWIKTRIALYPKGRQASAVIPILMRAQEQDGWVTRATIEYVADLLGMPVIRVLEVATFYTQFQLVPVGTRAHVQVCGTTPCMLRGAEDLRAVCQRKIHPEPHQRNAAGTLSWEEVECLGACVNAPMVAIGPDTYEDLTAVRLEQIIEAFGEGRGSEITPGPQIDRVFAAPESGRVTLLEVPEPAPAPVATPASPQEPAPDTVPMSPPAAKASVADGAKDDLKLISGVGPVIEKKLNALGLTRFAQIAAFSAADIEDVDTKLNFKGRIERDNWLEQADALARGGADEYRKIFGKEPR